MLPKKRKFTPSEFETFSIAPGGQQEDADEDQPHGSHHDNENGMTLSNTNHTVGI